jgi:hypothetical protein
VIATSTFQRTTMITLGIEFDKIQWIPFAIVYLNLKITEKSETIRASCDPQQTQINNFPKTYNVH